MIEHCSAKKTEVSRELHKYFSFSVSQQTNEKKLVGST